MVAEFQPREMLGALAHHQVEFVVIGGYSANLHGSPLPTPWTWTSRRGESATAAVGVGKLTTRYGDLDISFVPTGTRGYEDLRQDAVEVRLGGLRVLVASLADVIRSKEAAGRDKDRRACPCSAKSWPAGCPKGRSVLHHVPAESI